MLPENGQNSFRRGVMTLVILSLLKREDMYGYQLVQQTCSSSGGKLTTQEGSLYPVLYKLLDQKLISDKKVLVGKRMTRVYYHLEPAGEQRLAELIREYEDVTQGVFRIIKGCGSDEECMEYPAVSAADTQEIARDAQTEEKDSVTGGDLRPGICF